MVIGHVSEGSVHASEFFEGQTESCLIQQIHQPYRAEGHQSDKVHRRVGSRSQAVQGQPESTHIQIHGIESHEDITLKREAYWNAIINRRLKAGEDLWSIFSIVSRNYDGIRAVKYNGKINFISNDNRILSPVWFDEAKCIRNGYFDVWKEGFGLNLVNKKGELALPYWAESIGDFNSGIATFYVRNKGWNYFREDGKVLLDDYAYRCQNFTGNIGRVQFTSDTPFHTIDRDGNFVETDEDSLYSNIYRRRKFVD